MYMGRKPIKVVFVKYTEQGSDDGWILTSKQCRKAYRLYADERYEELEEYLDEVGEIVEANCFREDW